MEVIREHWMSSLFLLHKRMIKEARSPMQAKSKGEI